MSKSAGHLGNCDLAQLCQNFKTIVNMEINFHVLYFTLRAKQFAIFLSERWQRKSDRVVGKGAYV